MMSLGTVLEVTVDHLTPALVGGGIGIQVYGQRRKMVPLPPLIRFICFDASVEFLRVKIEHILMEIRADQRQVDLGGGFGTGRHVGASELKCACPPCNSAPQDKNGPPPPGVALCHE
jgi:hypothetical protein